MKPLLLFCLILAGCSRGGSNSSTPAPENTRDLPGAVAPQFVIGTNDFLGITPGQNTADVLASHPDLVDPRPRNSGEGLQAYLLTSRGQDVGYFLTSGPEAAISAVVVLTPDARTAEGLGVGSTLDDIRALHPGAEVHGSEMESRVTTEVGPHLFQFDIYIARYDLNPGEVPGSTKVNQVWLTHAPAAQ